MNRPAQTRKVAANQTFFEYQPARLYKPGGPSLHRFDPPRVADAPITHFDENGLGQETNNLTAIHSLRGYRTLRWGRNMELIITDQRSYRSEEPTYRADVQAFMTDDFPGFVPAYIRPLFCRGKGPFRWVALSGDPEDIYRTDRRMKELQPENDRLHQEVRSLNERLHVLERIATDRSTQLGEEIERLRDAPIA